MSSRVRHGAENPERGGDGRRMRWSESPIPRVGVPRRVPHVGATAVPPDTFEIRPDALYGAGAVTGGAGNDTCRDDTDSTYVTVSNTASKTLEFEACTSLPEDVVLTGATITIRARGTTYPDIGYYTINMYCAENIAPDATYTPNYGYFVTTLYADPTIVLTDDWVDYSLPPLPWDEVGIPLASWEDFTAAVIAGEVQYRAVGQIWSGADPSTVSMDISEAWLTVTW